MSLEFNITLNWPALGVETPITPQGIHAEACEGLLKRHRLLQSQYLLQWKFFAISTISLVLLTWLRTQCERSLVWFPPWEALEFYDVWISSWSLSHMEMAQAPDRHLWRMITRVSAFTRASIIQHFTPLFIALL